MEFETREALKRMAEHVADRLLAALKLKAIPKIDIHVIRTELRKEAKCPRDDTNFDMLEEMTMRRVVERV